MHNKIIYNKTLFHYIFQGIGYDVEKTNLLLQLIEKYYDDSIINSRKVWSNFNYLNSLIFTFLTLHSKIINKKAMFFALVFKYAYLDDYLRDNEDLNYLNINYFKSFVSQFPRVFI